MVRSVHPDSEKNFGDPIKYDPDFNGPLKKRSCTDVICLLLFAVFIACWIGVGVFAIKKGDADLILVPQDSKGRRCGHETDVEHKPYLFFIDITKCIGPQVLISKKCNTEQVCVEKCPSEAYTYQPSNDLKKALCVDGIKPATEADLIRNVDLGLCAKWYLPSTPVLKRCVFLELPARLGGLDEAGTRTLATRIHVGLSWLSLSVQNTIAHFTDNENAQKMVSLIAEDLVQSWWKILLGFGGAIIICLIYIVLMRWIAGIMVWLSIVGVIVLLSVGVYITATKYIYLRDHPPKDTSDLTLTDKDAILREKNVWLAFLIIVSALLIIALLIVIFLRKRIVIAVALIREGSKAVSAVTSSLFFPIVPWLCQILVIAFAITVGLYLTSVGDPVYKVDGVTETCLNSKLKNGDSCDPKDFGDKFAKLLKSDDCKNLTCRMDSIYKPPYINALHAFNIVGVFWGTFFISALGEMVLAATFATWYWTFRKSDVPFLTLTHSMARTFRYHLGTLAFGSLIITICRLIRVAIEYVDHKLKKYDNAFVNAILCCCKCFFWCLEKFLKFINKNAYIMCAIHGRNFCMSAKDAFNLLMRNMLRVFVLDKVTDMLFFLAKILVTATVGVVAYTALTNADFQMADTSDLHYVLVPVIAIAIGAYFISSVFFSVYSMAVDTLFLCFLEDCERNDGSPDKPYYMSKELMKILGKKNKKL